MPLAQAEDDKSLYQNVFGARTIEATLPLSMNGEERGEIRVKLKGETLEAVEKQSLLQALSKRVQKSFYTHLEKAPPWIEAKDLKIPLQYSPQNVRLEMELSPEDQAGHKLDVYDHPEFRYKKEALQPAPFGGAINYRVEKAWGADTLGGNSFGTYFDSFINMGGVVLESQSNYQDSNVSGTGWFRGDTRLVKDFPKNRVRTQVGDVYPSNFGFMPSGPVGGVMIARNFTLNPYRIPFPQGQGNFVLRTRSRVRTFVNGVQVKDETLPPGNYDLRNVPLTNGLNTVVVEATDELGERKVYEFRLPTSVGLLNQGDWNFSLSHGRHFQDSLFKRDYSPTEDSITSGYVQHGITRNYSLGGYAQNQRDFNLAGIENGLATSWGNFFLGATASKQDETAAGAGSGTWQLQKIGTQLLSTYTFTLRNEQYAPGFKTSAFNQTQTLKSQWQTNITVPVRELLTASLGASWGEVRDTSKSNRRGWDAALNLRAWRNLNINFFVSRNRDENKQWNDIAYVFFTWTFDGANHLISGFHDFENKVNRITAIRDNGNRLYSPRITATAEEGPTRDGGEIDAFVPTPMADIGGRLTGAKFDTSDSTYSRGVARLSSALVFAYEDGNMGVGLSRPVPNSFVLFRPSKELRRQKVGLRSTSPFTEGESGPFGEITFTNILPYQYREIQLDPTNLDEGTSLDREKFVVYPTYRSAHLIPLRDRGTVVLTGELVNAKGKPMGLKVGEVGGKPFFTTREGRFFIEGLGAGNYTLKLNDSDAGVPLKIQKSERGVKDLGVVPYVSEER